MFWMITAVGLLGLLLGLKYKIASLIASCGVVVALISAFAIHGGWPLSAAAPAIIASVSALQGAYLTGLLISAKARSRQRQPTRTN